MTDNVDNDIDVPQELVDALKDYIDEQDRQRQGPSLRDVVRDDAGAIPPYPEANNPMLRFLLVQARARLDAGVQARNVLVDLAATAWMEGHIEGFDHGYSAAQPDRD